MRADAIGLKTPSAGRAREGLHTLAAFQNIHAGGKIVVCACGESLNALNDPGRFVTIGVNDVGRRFDPEYLVVVDPPESFKGDRFQHVQASRAGVFFTQRSDLGIDHPHTVRFSLGTKDGTDFSNPNVLNYSVTTPYVALCLAIHMGAANVGLIGVDFTDHHFFGETGPHPWSDHLRTIDQQFGQLCRAALCLGTRVFNLSPRSRMAAAPKMTLESFRSLPDAPSRPAERALRIVSYATTPVAGVPAILAGCINARTPNLGRCVWAGNGYGNGVSWTGDVEWSTAPECAVAELEAAEVVIVHNGKVDPRHRGILADKPVITMAHNYMWNVDTGFFTDGFPGLVVGQYQATLPEFAGWTVVPNPVAVWEEDAAACDKPAPVTIAYTPSGCHDAYPPGHKLYWHSKGFTETMRVLESLAARWQIRLETTGTQFVPYEQSLAMKRRAHIVIDECVTGSYHRNSLEGLATGCVVVNGLGLLPGVEEALRHCAAGGANPFHCTGLSGMKALLESLIALGPCGLSVLGGNNRFWMARHWEFADQWPRFWLPAIGRAMDAAQRRKRTRRAATFSGAHAPNLSLIIASRDEGPFLRRTVSWFSQILPANSEIVVIDDGSVDGSADFLFADDWEIRRVRNAVPAGTARARNAGARLASGRILLFCDAHVAMTQDAVRALAEVLVDPDIGACGPAIRAMRSPEDFVCEIAENAGVPQGLGCVWTGPELRTCWLTGAQSDAHDVPLLAGPVIAVRRTVFASVGGFDPNMTEGGHEDAEFSLRLWRLGYRCVAVPSASASHLFRSVRTWPLSAEAVLKNKLRLAHLHFSDGRKQAVFKATGGLSAAAPSLARLDENDAAARRESLAALCLRDDDWFFQRFAEHLMPGVGWPC